MKVKIRNILFFLVVFPTVINGQTPPNDKNWESTPYFSDDFNVFDPIKWRKQFNWGNYKDGRDMIYLPSQVFIDNSRLILKAEEYSDPNYPAVNYKSGLIESYKNDFTYGFFEIKCKLSSNGNLYNLSFWVYNGNNCQCDEIPYDCDNGWSDEIDFFEAFCGDPVDLSSNIHVKAGNCDEWGGIQDHIITNLNLITQDHIYGYEWTPNRVIFYLDGIPYQYINDSHVPYHGLYLVIQLSDRENGSIETPGYMDVEYVKVFNLKREFIDKSITNFNSSTFDPGNYKVYKTIAISGTSNVNSNDKVTFRAQNGITITGNFTVNTGGELILLQTYYY